MFTLRPATSADAPDLTAIYAHYVTHTAVSFEYKTPSVAEFSARMEQVRAHQLPYLVAEAEGQLLVVDSLCIAKQILLRDKLEAEQVGAG